MYVEDDVENPSQDTEDINEVLLTVSCMDFFLKWIKRVVYRLMR